MTLPVANGDLKKHHTFPTVNGAYHRHARYLQFACWLAKQPKPPPLEAQCEIAGEIFQRTMSPRHVAAVKRNSDFLAYFERAKRGGAEAAKDLLDQDFGFYAAAHKEATEQLLTLGQYKEVAKFTTPMIDRAYPKKPDAPAPPAIIIHFTPQQLAVFQREAVPAIEVEALALPDRESEPTRHLPNV